ncbi:MAG: Cell division protein FtsA [Actinobacteria bacterium ADurb.Bin346]|nr:MAG: Cell division protein FtsA [Actinobacteria bacterium ADurb.Bin346]
MPARDEYIAAIDIGTTKVCTFIGSVKKNNTIEIKGYGSSECKGIKKGLVVDINESIKSILASIGAAEKSTSMFIDSAYIGVTGKHISFLNNWTEINISSPGKIVRKSDVDRLIGLANKINISSEHYVIHTLIKQFALGEEKDIADPVGLSTDKLAVELLIIYGSIIPIRNIINSIKAANIEIEDIMLEALASGEAVLTPEEKESGVIVMDIGGGTTDVAIYRNRKMIFTYCLPVGGDLVTNDISIGLNIPFAKAEEIKKKFANVDINFYETLNRINMDDIMLDKNRATLNIRLYSIVNDRLKELLNLVKEKIEAYGFIHSIPCGLVITGGTANLKGIAALAENVFNMPARIGTSLDVEGPSEVVGNPIYATAIGILKYANQIRNFLDLGQFDGRRQKSKGFAARFREFIMRILRND